MLVALHPFVQTAAQYSVEVKLYIITCLCCLHLQELHVSVFAAFMALLRPLLHWHHSGATHVTLK